MSTSVHSKSARHADVSSVRCLVCSGNNLTVYIDGRDETLMPSMVGSSRTTFAPGRILRCRDCRFAFRQLRPSDDELVTLYQRFDTKTYDAESAGRSRTAAQHVKIVGSYAHRPGRILDVGCASGIFLRAALDAGWEAVGIDPSPVLARQAKQLLGERAEIHSATLQSGRLPESSFDVLTLWDILEHVRDPSLFLRQCAHLLKPGGHLLANVPDLDSVQSRCLRSRWPLLLPEHLNYFTARSLRVCGENAGLTWLGFRRRPVAFSVDYVLYRLRQHGIPATSIAQKLVARIGLGRRIVWLALGEICGAWSSEQATPKRVI